MIVDVERTLTLERTSRQRQVEAAFELNPDDTHQRLRWHASLPIEDRDWNVGLIVGPSGSGKSTLLSEAWGAERTITWDAPSIVDDFAAPLEDVMAICQAVGLNTIPAWLRPYSVLSNGERFRADLARQLIESVDGKPIVLDEFTSVVDRQVAQIGAHATQKWVRRAGRQLVAATCHYDVEDWLQPDWVLEPRLNEPSLFRWRSLQPRPPIAVTIERAPYSAWALFAPFHYLTGELNRAARCFVAYVGDTERPAAFGGVLAFPHPKVRNIMRLSRLVTLPDWQGLGLAFVLSDTLGAAYKAVGYRYRTYPGHPALTRAFDRSNHYALISKPGIHGAHRGPNSADVLAHWRFGSNANAVFEYIGPCLDSKSVASCLTGKMT